MNKKWTTRKQWNRIEASSQLETLAMGLPKAMSWRVKNKPLNLSVALDYLSESIEKMMVLVLGYI